MNLYDLQCRCCGGGLVEIEGSNRVAKCQFCGRKQSIPIFSDEKRANQFSRAEQLRKNNDYDKAISLYERLIEEDPTDPEAFWSMVLCRYGIEYVKDPRSGEQKPTVNRAQYTSILADEDYRSAIKYATDEQKELYEAEAKQINEIQKGILEIASNEEPFDIFICYKETDENGRRTKDSALAQELYHELERDGYKVFFARVTLDGKLGSAYEPYIFSALNSSKVMVVLGTKPEYFNAVWVKNEWSRFLGLIKNGEKKSLIPAYKDMDAYELPEEFSHLQALNMDKLGFMADLVMGIEKILAFHRKDDKKPEEPSKPSEPSPSASAPAPVVKKKSKAPIIFVALLLVAAIVAGAIVVPKLMNEEDTTDVTDALTEVIVDGSETESEIDASDGSESEKGNEDTGSDSADGPFNPAASGGETESDESEDGTSDDTDDPFNPAVSGGEDSDDETEDTQETESDDDFNSGTGGSDTSDKEETSSDNEETSSDEDETDPDKEETSSDKEETRSDKEETSSEKEETAPIEPTECEHKNKEVHEAKKAECEESGYNAYSYCPDCKKYFDTNGEEIPSIPTISPKGHTEVIDKAVDATCEETGLTEGIHCSVCEKVIKVQQTVKAKGHTEVIDKAVAATCEETGLTEGKHCSVCDKVIKAQTVVQAKGHTEVIDKAVAPKCEETGLTQGIHCSVCDKVIKAQETVDATGHTSEAIQAVAPTCENSGSGEGSRCSVCKKTLEEPEVIDPIGHKAGEPDPDDGCNVYCANNCGKLMEENRHGESLVDINDHCKLKCSVCKNELGGSSHETYVDHDDNCNEKCSKCHDIIEEGKHETDPESAVITQNPTYSEVGQRTYYCKNCGGVSETEEIPVLDDLKFEANSSGGYTVFNNGAYGNVEIPTEYKGLPVTEIGNFAFENATGIENLIIPDSITRIGSSAFKGSDIVLTTLPASIKTIDTSAFENCTGITSLNLPEGISGIGNFAFRGCTNLNSVTIPNTLTSIGSESFSGCTGITEASVPTNALSAINKTALKKLTVTGGESINPWLFQNNNVLEEVSIASSVKTIGNNAFYQCTALKTVTFEGESQLTEIGGDAFEGCVLLSGVTLPETLTTIGNEAFNGCRALTSINIPASVTTIGSRAFGNCSLLESVVIGDNSQLEAINDNTFYQCVALESVDFGENSKIGSIGTYAFGECTSLTTISIPDSVTVVHNYAFYGDAAITNSPIGVGSQLQTIGNYAFQGCQFPISTFPTNLTDIGSNAFADNKAITSLSFPEGIKRVENGAFAGCTNVTSIYIPETVEYTGDAFRAATNLTTFTGPTVSLNSISRNNLVSVVITNASTDAKDLTNGSIFSGCTKLESITLPANLTSINGQTFRGCTALREVIFEGESQLQSIGVQAFYECTSLAEIDLPDTLTTIGDEAFHGSGLTSITIPAGVNSLGRSAFKGCAALESVVICDNSQLEIIDEAMFYQCVALESVNFGENSKIGSIGTYAFGECTSLTTISIPDSVTVVHNYAFYGDAAITNSPIGVGSQLQTIGNYAFQGCQFPISTFPTNLTDIGSNAFADNKAITSLSFPEGIKRVENGAFAGCTNVTSIYIPETVEYTGDAFRAATNLTTFTGPTVSLNSISRNNLVSVVITNASTDAKDLTNGSIFSGCTKLESITLPANLTSINGQTFRGCTALREVIFEGESQLQSIGVQAFYECTSLAEIDLPDTLTTIDNEAFQGSGLTSITIPAGVNSLGRSAFFGCSKLESVVIGDNSQLEVINDTMFYQCSELESIDFGENSKIASINQQAFAGCSSLTSITIPDSVTTIGNYVFHQNTALTAIYIGVGSQLTSIGGFTFDGCISNPQIHFAGSFEEWSAKGVTGVTVNMVYNSTKQ